MMLSMNTINLKPDEMFLLLVGAVRYALGRSTYIVSSTCSLIRRHLKDLSYAHKLVLSRDIQSALDHAHREGHTLGMDMDDREWKEILEELKA